MAFSVALSSGDKTLVGFFRDVLSEAFGSDWTLRHASPGEVPPQSDVWLWDYAPGGESFYPALPEGFGSRNQWFLLKPGDLAKLQSQLGTPEINVLLKPVTRPALRTFLTGTRAQIEGGQKNGAPLIDETRMERDNLLQSLIQSNLRLQEFEHDRGNFLVRSLHDLHGPLTAIKGYCRLLLDGDLGLLTTSQNRVIRDIHLSARRISRLSDAIYRLGVPQNPDLTPTSERADVPQCVEKALNEVGGYLETKRISVKVNIGLPTPELAFENAGLELALVNLLENACKSTPRDGCIEIRGYEYFWERRSGVTRFFDCPDRRCRRTAVLNTFRIDVKDSGPRLSAAQLDRLFDESAAPCDGQDRSVAGIGLAVCRVVVRRNKGHIWVENTATGPVFSLVIPLPQSKIQTTGPDGTQMPITGGLENESADGNIREKGSLIGR